MRGTDAVSPVLGVMLLVAITVTLTATVFMVANGLGSKSDKPAPVVFPTKDEANGRLVVVHADSQIPVSRLRIEMTAAGHFAYNALASSASSALPANTLEALGPTGIITGGDSIYLCVDATTSNIQVLLQDPITNKVLATETFGNLPVCA